MENTSQDKRKRKVIARTRDKDERTYGNHNSKVLYIQQTSIMNAQIFHRYAIKKKITKQ